MQEPFAGIRANTPPDAVLLANLDPVLYFYTGRKAVRGFSPNGYQAFYAAKQTLVTPDRLLDSIPARRRQLRSRLTRSRLCQAPLFHQTVEALERGGRSLAREYPRVVRGLPAAARSADFVLNPEDRVLRYRSMVVADQNGASELSVPMGSLRKPRSPVLLENPAEFVDAFEQTGLLNGSTGNSTCRAIGERWSARQVDLDFRIGRQGNEFAWTLRARRSAAASSSASCL